MRIPTRMEFLLATAFVVVACGGGSSAPAGSGVATDAGSPGSEGSHCYPNGTCNSGLSCFSKLCVKVPPASMGTGGATRAKPPDGGLVSTGGTSGIGGTSTGGLGGQAAGGGGTTSNGGCAAGIGGALVVGRGGDCSAIGVCVAQVLPTGINVTGCLVGGCAPSIVCSNTGGASGCPVGNACAVIGVRSASGACLVGGGATNNVCTPGNACVADPGATGASVCTPTSSGSGGATSTGGTDAGQVTDAAAG